MKRILAVDDSSSVRQMVGFTLRKAGYEVVEAIDGKDGLGQGRQCGKFDLIITDLNMPNMDGIQMITAVRKLPGCSFLPILMLTTESQAEKKGCRAQSRRYRLDCEAVQCGATDRRSSETGEVEHMVNKTPPADWKREAIPDHVHDTGAVDDFAREASANGGPNEFATGSPALLATAIATNQRGRHNYRYRGHNSIR